jgi:hypothetical protein
LQPVVFRFSDAHGRVNYVGKAKNLRSRLTWYFADIASLHPRTRQLVATAAKVEWTVVTTEVELAMRTRLADLSGLSHVAAVDRPTDAGVRGQRCATPWRRSPVLLSPHPVRGR